jgi:hypothetical protein
LRTTIAWVRIRRGELIDQFEGTLTNAISFWAQSENVAELKPEAHVPRVLFQPRIQNLDGLVVVFLGDQIIDTRAGKPARHG